MKFLLFFLLLTANVHAQELLPQNYNIQFERDETGEIVHYVQTDMDVLFAKMSCVTIESLIGDFQKNIKISDPRLAAKMQAMYLTKITPISFEIKAPQEMYVRGCILVKNMKGEYKYELTQDSLTGSIIEDTGDELEESLEVFLYNNLDEYSSIEVSLYTASNRFRYTLKPNTVKQIREFVTIVKKSYVDIFEHVMNLSYEILLHELEN